MTLILVVWLVIISLAVADLFDRQRERSQTEQIDLSEASKRVQAEYWRWRRLAEQAERHDRQSRSK